MRNRNDEGELIASAHAEILLPPSQTQYDFIEDADSTLLIMGAISPGLAETERKQIFASLQKHADQLH